MARSLTTPGRHLVPIAVLIVLVAAACGSSSDTQVAGEPSNEAGAETTGAMPESGAEPDPTGPVLPVSVFDATATTLGGEPFDLGPLANADLVLWFWAPW